MDKAKLEIGETTPKLFLDFFYISHGDILGSIAIDALDVLPIATPLSHQDEFRLQQRGVNTRRVKSRDFQNMSAPDNILMRAGNVWQDYAAIAGVGQFSLVNQSPFSVLAKVMVYKRNASPEEVQEDFEIFGERVVGNPLKNLSEERREGKPYIEVHGEKFLYTGPQRIEKCVFVTRAFPGVPEEITDVLDQLDRPEDFSLECEGFRFFTADKGVLRCAESHVPPINYISLSLNLHNVGKVFIQKDKLGFIIDGEPKGTDYSELMFKAAAIPK